MTVSNVSPSSTLEHDSIQSMFAWAGRMGGGRAVDAISSNQSRPVSVGASRATSYANILGLDESLSGKENFNRLKPSTVLEHLKSGQVSNMANSRTGAMTAGRFAKETLLHNNTYSFKDFKSAPGTAISKGLGLGLLGYHVAGQTKDGYDAAKAKYGDNSAAVAASTAGTLGISAAKAGVTWEVSNVLYDVGRTTLPKMTVGRVPLGGILMGAVGAVAAAHALDKVIPPPKSPGKASESSDATYDSMRQAVNSGNPFNSAPSAQSASVGQQAMARG